MPSVRLRALLATLALSISPLVAAQAQATMAGIVRDDSTGTPLTDVEVLINGTSFSTRTNGQGRYVLTGLPTGTRQAIFRLLGHLPQRVDVLLADGDTTRANATLIRSDVVLDPIIVTGDAPTRGVGLGREAIEERRRLGMGRYVDADMLRRYEATLHLDDVLRRHADIDVRMVRLDGVTTYLAYNRTHRNYKGELDCIMSVYHNGSPVAVGGIVRGDGNSSGGIRAIDLRTFPLLELDAVEVYRSAAEVPTEYGGASSACGVILLWSRVAP
jgi:hypothetical protein